MHVCIKCDISLERCAVRIVGTWGIYVKQGVIEVHVERLVVLEHHCHFGHAEVQPLQTPVARDLNGRHPFRVEGLLMLISNLLQLSLSATSIIHHPSSTHILPAFAVINNSLVRLRKHVDTFACEHEDV